MSEWAEAKIADVAAASSRAIAIGPFGSSLRAELYTESGVPVLRGQNLSEGKEIDRSDLVFVDPSVADRFPACIVRAGDLVFPHRGAIGRVGIVNEGEFLLSSSMMKLTCDRRRIVPAYLFYWFRGPGREELLSRASTVGTPGIGQPLRSLRGITVPVPPLGTQRGIAEVLGALDDKIAANERVANLLLSLMESYYERAVHEGATCSKLEDVAEFHNRRRIPLSARERDGRPGRVPYYGATGVFGHVDEALFDEVLLLVGEDGSVITEGGRPVVQYIWGPAWVNNHAHVLTGKSVSTELLRFAVARSDVRHLVTGAVQPKISMGKLRSLQLAMPKADQRAPLEQLLKQHSAALRARSDEISVLSTLRDALLPQLMSGKIRVKDAERAGSEVV